MRLERPRLDGLRLAAARIGLPAWFIAIDLLWVARPDVLGIDARHYQRAASAWLAGGDPWAVTESGVTVRGRPAHAALLRPDQHRCRSTLSVAFWLVLGLAASAWLVRRLELPVWWLLFPPLAHAIWNGNSQTMALALPRRSAGRWPPVASRSGDQAVRGHTASGRPRLLVVAGDRTAGDTAVPAVAALPRPRPRRQRPPPDRLERKRLAVPDPAATRRPCSACGSCAARAPSGWRSRRSGRRRSSTTSRWRCRRRRSAAGAWLRRSPRRCPLMAPAVVMALAARETWQARRARGQARPAAGSEPAPGRERRRAVAFLNAAWGQRGDGRGISAPSRRTRSASARTSGRIGATAQGTRSSPSGDPYAPTMRASAFGEGTSTRLRSGSVAIGSGRSRATRDERPRSLGTLGKEGSAGDEQAHVPDHGQRAGSLRRRTARLAARPAGPIAADRPAPPGRRTRA